MALCPLYPGNYHTDTMLMTAEEHIALQALLLNEWVRGDTLDLEESALARCAGTSRAQWRVLKPFVAPVLADIADAIAEKKQALAAVVGERLPGRAWEIARSIVFARDDYACVYCGARDRSLHCDHVLALANGGSNAIENLATACAPCNAKKGAKSVLAGSRFA